MISSRTEHGRTWWRSSCPPRLRRRRNANKALLRACTASLVGFGPLESKSTPFFLCVVNGLSKCLPVVFDVVTGREEENVKK
ncbi:hypothetical protein Hanom_Chr16g01463111 [Helianthus anomalus]